MITLFVPLSVDTLHAMKTIVLDTNIFQLVDSNDGIKTQISSLISDNKIKIIIPANVVRELANGPFNGIPNWFPTEEVTDSVFVLGHTPLGEGSLGSGEVFNRHRGESKKISDAVIADTAATDADVFVSNDKRARSRLKKIKPSCQAYDFDEFRTYLSGI